ncbi:MAG TPA: GlsB/YeaQ/YmgE family stress response membrane protein [Polyangiaceae bacterium]
MTLVGAVVLLVIAGMCGSIGAGLAGYTHKGCLASIVFGFVGAWVGSWMAGQVHLPLLYVLHFRGESFPVVWSIIGAAILAATMSILTARKPHGF